MKAAWGRLGSRFVLSGSSHWEAEQSQAGMWAPCSHSPCSCPLSAEAREPSLPEERQPPGAAGTMAGGRLGEAPWLPPTGLAVPQHPQVSTPAASPPPPHPALGQSTLGPWALGPCLGGTGRQPMFQAGKLRPRLLCAWSEATVRRLRGVKELGVDHCPSGQLPGPSQLSPQALDLIPPLPIWFLGTEPGVKGKLICPSHCVHTHMCPVTSPAHTHVPRHLPLHTHTCPVTSLVTSLHTWPFSHCGRSRVTHPPAPSPRASTGAQPSGSG